jgi:hypothetical protein
MRKPRRGRAKHGAEWSRDDVLLLRNEWNVLSRRRLQHKLQRTWIAIMVMAKRLKLPFGVPQGHETLTQAARRCNYSTWKLRQILAWAGVRLHRPYGQGRQQAQRIHALYIDPEHVDTAVREYLALETLSHAARQRGMATQTLLKLLVAAGKVPATRKPRTAVRLPPEVYDAVVIAWRRTVTGRRSATMSANLRASGVHIRRAARARERARAGTHARV